ncbi:hypothetical protein PI124_g11904 [Phytophthora idaei]|nr:hypothetical protein PI125_g14343 [Phytophthora idaei]KAG3145958.1 hypothetical protein PI126_g13520 [Phytophthora idaei]KAG3243277.1 hypothetical protein PI124_g11904 [Phytophthora idaei]
MLNVKLITLHTAYYILADSEDDLSKRGSELLVDNNDDLNAVELDQNSDQYGAIESGDEAETDDVQTGEYDSDGEGETSWAPDDVGDDAEETETEIAAEVLFAENFSESFGGENEVLACNLKNEVLRSISATGWEDLEETDIYEHMMEPHEPVSNSDSYPALRQGYSGPTGEASRHGDSPVALFSSVYQLCSGSMLLRAQMSTIASCCLSRLTHPISGIGRSNGATLTSPARHDVISSMSWKL